MVCILIITAPYKPTAEAFVEQLYPASAWESFTIPLGPVGSAEITHWACVPICSDAIAEQIRQLSQQPQFAGHVYLSTCEPEHAATMFDAACEELGLVRLTEAGELQ